MEMMTVRSNVGERAVTLVIDPEAARRSLRQLYEAYGAKQKLYASVGRENAPQTRFLPTSIEKGSLEHRIWLFFAALNDRRDASENVYRIQRNLWETRREFYTAEVLSLESETFVKLLREAGISMATTSARNWLISARAIFGHYEGDPIRIYDGSSIDELHRFSRKKISIAGYGTKLLSLLALFYQEAGVLPVLPDNTFPIDLHAQRFALAQGIVKTGENTSISNSLLESHLRRLFYYIATQEGFEVLELAHALWLLGNGMCTRCSRTAGARDYCPVFESCGGGLPTRAYFTHGKWQVEEARYRRGGDNSLRIPEGPLTRFFETQ